MEFFTQSKLKRPIRLSAATRQFAYDSLNRKYGLDTWKTPCVTLDGVDGFESMTELEKYDIAVRKIAEEAPIRICEGELISGAATLGRALWCDVPALREGKAPFHSVSHLTVDFETVLQYGINHIRSTAEISLDKHFGTEREAFSQSCLNCLDAFSVWHRRYLDTLKKMPEYRANYENLCRVPFEPARNFYEAVQSLWFTFAFLRLCGVWSGFGRIDYLLGDYLKNDLESGNITLDKAREILAHFFIKGCEWVCGQSVGAVGSGDAQHYQNILLGGIDEDGNDVTN